MLDELPRHRFELFHQGPSLFELATRRMIFEVRRHGTDHGGKRRHRPAKLVSGLAQPNRVPVPQRLLNRGHVVRQARPKHLTNLFQGGGVAPAGGQHHARVEQTRFPVGRPANGNP